MKRGCGSQPREEGGVLHRVPRPVAAPTEHLVSPPAAQHDRHREVDPGQEEEVAQRPDEVVAQPADEERGAGEAEGDRHPHVPRVEEGRVDDHQEVVLQERVGTRPVQRRTGHRRERLRRTGEQEAEEGAAREPDADRVRHVLGMLVPVLPGSDRDVHAHHQAPEEDRSFQRRPEADQRDPGGHRPRADVGHVAHAEVVAEERVLHEQIGEGHEGRERVGEAPRPQPAEGGRTRPRGETDQRSAARGEEREEDQRAAEHRDHLDAGSGWGLDGAEDPATAGRGAGTSSNPCVERISVFMSTFLSAGARYLLSWETINRWLSNAPCAVIVPSTTTPMRSRKSWGGTPRETTWTRAVPSVTSNSRFETPSPSFTEPGATCPPSRMVAPTALRPAARSSLGPQ